MREHSSVLMGAGRMVNHLPGAKGGQCACVNTLPHRGVAGCMRERPLELRLAAGVKLTQAERGWGAYVNIPRCQGGVGAWLNTLLSRGRRGECVNPSRA